MQSNNNPNNNNNGNSKIGNFPPPNNQSNGENVFFYQEDSDPFSFDNGGVNPNVNNTNQNHQNKTSNPNQGVKPETDDKQNPKAKAKKSVDVDDLKKIMSSLKPELMSSSKPIRIDEPSYLITETQMQELLNLKESNPDLFDSKGGKSGVTHFLANATLGTVGRVGHTLTSVADNVIDIVSLGYGSRKK